MSVLGSLPYLTTLFQIVGISYRLVQNPKIVVSVREAASLRKYMPKKEMEAVTGRLVSAKDVKKQTQASWKMFEVVAKPRSAEENQPGWIICLRVLSVPV